MSNLFCIGIAVLGLARWALSMQAEPAAWAVVWAAVLFGICTYLFSRGLLGGGDVKLIAATALLIGGDDTPAFLFLMSVIGSVLALIILICKLVLLIYIKVGPFFGAIMTEEDGAAITASDLFKVPYGVAVAAAASVVLILPQIQRA